MKSQQKLHEVPKESLLNEKTGREITRSKVESDDLSPFRRLTLPASGWVIPRKYTGVVV